MESSDLDWNTVVPFLVTVDSMFYILVTALQCFICAYKVTVSLVGPVMLCESSVRGPTRGLESVKRLLDGGT
jgi:hypothetical protein